MKRIELFEFEDQKWIPAFLRDCITNLIEVFHRLLNTSDLLQKQIAKMRIGVKFDQIIDLGSGSGGTMPEVVSKYNKIHREQPLSLSLSDLYPHKNAIKYFNSSQDHVRYISNPIDATDLSKAPGGLKTMIACFHHFSPIHAKKILASAQKNNQPILIYEIADNFMPLLLWCLLLPISLTLLICMVLLMTPFVKRLTIAQIIFTYIIPIIPIMYAWDGQASLMRTYTFKDIHSLLEELPTTSNYKWKVAYAKNKKNKNAGYTIVGMP